MKLLYPILLIFILTACSEKKAPEKLSRDCQLELRIYGRPGEHACAAFFNLTDKTKDTLYVSNFRNIDGKDSTITKKIKLNPAEQDTLFSCFQSVKEKFNPEDSHPALDGTRVCVSILNSGRAVSYYYLGLSRANDAGYAVDKMIRFINKRLDEDNQMQ